MLTVEQEMLLRCGCEIVEEKIERLDCIECGKTFRKRVNTKIDNLFCSTRCEDAHAFRRYYEAPSNKPYISNVGAIARTNRDYYGGYTE